MNRPTLQHLNRLLASPLTPPLLIAVAILLVLTARDQLTLLTNRKAQALIIRKTVAEANVELNRIDQLLLTVLNAAGTSPDADQIIRDLKITRP